MGKRPRKQTGPGTIESSVPHDVLQAILQGLTGGSGKDFFPVLVQNLSIAIDAHRVIVTEYDQQAGSATALALITGERILTDCLYPLAGTPCEKVINDGESVHHTDDVKRIYPGLESLGIRSYLGMPLLYEKGFVIGHLAAMAKHPMPYDPMRSEVFKIFASRAASELALMQAERERQELRKRLIEAISALEHSEERFRDLFEEAPIAYVHEDIDSRFIRANRTALRILGIKPEEARGTYGRSLVPDTPEAQARVQNALDSIGRGESISGVILELRRKDNGKPVWIEWWSSPAPDRSYTRTMFIDITDKVLMSKQKELLKAQNIYLQEELREAHIGKFIGESEKMRRVFEDLEQVAPTNSTVLVLGETGTGKELVARAIHAASARNSKPLIKVNCGALPSSLIESELFGHEKGAFTGATAARDGRFAIADGGTIFLDEIGDLPNDLQVKLLRVLQEGAFERVGSSKTRNVDVRVIAATNRDLLAAVQNGEFREDLYYRLAVFPVELPPLRDRDVDVVLLANEFSAQQAKRTGRAIAPLRDSEIERLVAYRWPGNVRELQNVIERAIITSVDGHLNLDRALPESAENSRLEDATAPPVRTAQEMQRMERENILLALKSSNWKVSGDDGAAKLLGINPSTLSSRIRALDIRKPG